MSVVAGCSLFDGVILAADSRCTICFPNGSKEYADFTQKLFVLTAHSAIGFAGDLYAASCLLNEIFTHLKTRSKKDSISLSRWLPRFLRYKYSKLKIDHVRHKVIFIVASIIKNRPNIVERKSVKKIADYIFSQKGPIKRNTIPNFIIELLKMPEQHERISLTGTSTGILYTLQSPSFKIVPFKPLNYVVVGSGEKATEAIDMYYDSIFAFDCGNSFYEAWELRGVIRRYLEKQGDLSVGGLYPVIKISGRGIERLGHYSERPAGGKKIQLSFENGYWYQRNLTEGTEVKLLSPWEITAKKFLKNNLFFNDLRGTY